MEMVFEGVTDEVEAIGRKYDWKGEALKGNIYRIFRGVTEGTKSMDDAIEEFVKSDMALAKRQMTWFKRNPSIHWSSDPQELESLVDTFLDRQSQ